MIKVTMVISVLMMVILNNIDDDVDDGVAVCYDYDNSSSGESVVDNDNNIGDIAIMTLIRSPSTGASMPWSQPLPE